jgi:hypothetical protein
LERSDTRGPLGLAGPPLIRRQPIVPAQYLHPQIDVHLPSVFGQKHF